MDADRPRRRGRRGRDPVRPRRKRRRRRGLRRRRRARPAGARRRLRDARRIRRSGARGGPLRGAVRLHRRLGVRAAGPLGAARRLRHHRGRHRPRPHGAGLRRGRLPARRASRDDPAEPGPPRRHVRRARPGLPGQARPRPQPGDRRGPVRLRKALQGGPLRARLPPLLALRHPVDLLRQVVLVHPHLRGPRPDARRERADRLASRPHQARPLRQVAGGQRRLGALPRALLGDAAADLDLHGRGLRRTGLRGLDRRADRARRGAAAAPRRRRRGDRPPPPLHRRRDLEVRIVRRRDAARPRGDRHLVRQRRDAVRAAPLPVRERGGVRAALPGRLHLRGDRPDPGLVLLPARRVGAPLRPDRLPELRLPRADPRSRGPEDEQAARQHRRPSRGDRRARRRCLPLVLPGLPAALGRLPVQRRHGRRVGPAVPADALEHVLVLRPLRQCRGHRRGGRRRAGTRGYRGVPGSGGVRRGPRPLGRLPPAGNDRVGSRAARRLRLDRRRQGHRRLRRRALELVRAGGPAPLLERRRRRLRHPAALPRRDRQAARSLHPLHRRRDLAQPRARRGRRRRGVRPPRRLPRLPTRRFATPIWKRGWRRPGAPSSSAVRPAPRRR